MADAESEKPWQRGSIAIRKVFANLESFCNKAYIFSKLSGWQGNCLDGQETVNLETVRTIWKLS